LQLIVTLLTIAGRQMHEAHDKEKGVFLNAMINTIL